MSNTVMLTLPRNRESIEEVYLLQWMFKNDIHKWIIAKEIGNDGYKHWQIRMQTRYTFDELKKAFPKAHIEEASDTWEYERKEGHYWRSEDTVEIHRTRFGELRSNQSRILRNLDKQDDRELDVIIDTVGKTGKSWLCRWLYEQGKGFYVPPTCKSEQAIIQFVASGYKGEQIIVIDIPRSTRWHSGLYVALEQIKDGLVFDTRYHSTTRDIHGAKVLVLTNSMPKVDKLSYDRWRLYDANGVPLIGDPTS